MYFPILYDISDINDNIKNKPEIKCYTNNDITFICYMIADENTFDNPYTLECRGIGFNQNGNVISRPLHKFFNLGEKGLSKEYINEYIQYFPIFAIYPKLDGSMIATCIYESKVVLRTKKGITDTSILATKYCENKQNYIDFFEEIKKLNLTAIFEYLDPNNPIVILYPKPELILLHVRDNITGEYVMIDKNHPIHNIIQKYNIPITKKLDLNLNELYNSLNGMKNEEGYVIQFLNGHMIKVKCPWYLSLHETITFLREIDIAEMYLNEQLDDLKSYFVQTGRDLNLLNNIENTIKQDIIDISNKIDEIIKIDGNLSRKEFAIKYKSNSYFGLLMEKYKGNIPDIKKYYFKSIIENKFSRNII